MWLWSPHLVSPTTVINSNGQFSSTTASIDQQSQDGTLFGQWACPWSICFSKEICSGFSGRTGTTPGSLDSQSVPPIVPCVRNSRIEQMACCMLWGISVQPAPLSLIGRETEARGVNCRGLEKPNVPSCHQLILDIQQTLTE